MTVEQLMDAIEVIDDSYVVKYTRGLPKKPQPHWGLISAAACFCLMVTSVIFVLSSGLIPAICTPDTAKLHASWQYVQPNRGALSENGYYHLENGRFLWCTDLNTGENRALCSKPGCNHGDSRCEAYIPTAYKSILYHDGYLYYYDSGDGTFHRRNADGTGDIFYDDPICVVDTQTFAAAGQYLYYTGWTDGTALERTEYRLVRMHLLTGKSEILWRREVPRDNTCQELTLLAVQDAGVLFLWSEGAKDASEAETESMPMHITFWDSASGTGTELLQRSAKELQVVQLVADGKLYFAGKGYDGKKPDTVVFDLTTGEEKTAFQNAYLHALGGGYAVLSKDDAWHVIRLSSGAEVPCDPLNPRLFAFATGTKGFVLRQTVYNSAGTDATGEIWYYLPYTAMADGIRKSDLVELYSLTCGFSNFP